MDETKNDQESPESKGAFKRRKPNLTAKDIIERGKKAEANKPPEDEQGDPR